MGVEDYKNWVDEDPQRRGASYDTPGMGHNSAADHAAEWDAAGLDVFEQLDAAKDVIEQLSRRLLVQTTAARSFNDCLTVVFMELARKGGPRQDNLNVVAERYREAALGYRTSSSYDSARYRLRDSLPRQPTDPGHHGVLPGPIDVSLVCRISVGETDLCGTSPPVYAKAYRRSTTESRHHTDST